MELMHSEMSDWILQVRPDAADDFARGVAACVQSEASEAINTLFRSDRAAFNAINLAATPPCHMTDEVRDHWSSLAGKCALRSA
jgi:hypothetical protein